MKSAKIATKINRPTRKRPTRAMRLRLKRRADVVTDGNIQAQVLKNAPEAREGFFAVPKVVE